MGKASVKKEAGSNKQKEEVFVWKGVGSKPEAVELSSVVIKPPRPIGECPRDFIGVGNVDIAGVGITEDEARKDLERQMRELCDNNPHTNKCVGLCPTEKCCSRVFLLASTIRCERVDLKSGEVAPGSGGAPCVSCGITPPGTIPPPSIGFKYVCRYKGLLSCGCDCVSCSTVPPTPSAKCQTVLKAIVFNHDPKTFHCDAMPGGVVPEWVPGRIRPEDSPAKYSISATRGNTITILVNFNASALPASNIDVSLVEIRANGGGVLGELDLQIVRFSKGVSVPEFVPFPLNHHKIGVSGPLTEDITWQWEYRCSCNSKWQKLANTNHRITIVA